MARKKLYFACLLASLLLLAGTVNAVQVSLAESTTGLIVFTNDGGHTVDMMFTGNCGVANCVAGYGLLGANLGVYKMWIVGGPPLLTPPDIFDIYGYDMNGATINFSMVLFGGKGSLLGTMDLHFLSGASTIAPVVIGDFMASSATGLFDGLWPIGVEVPDDYTVSLHWAKDIDAVFLGTVHQTKGPLSSGEIMTTPEPVSLALLGTGVLTLAGLVRRRLF